MQRSTGVPSRRRNTIDRIFAATSSFNWQSAALTVPCSQSSRRSPLRFVEEKSDDGSCGTMHCMVRPEDNERVAVIGLLSSASCLFVTAYHRTPCNRGAAADFSFDDCYLPSMNPDLQLSEA
eukprot:scaffold912_cov153-Amphora_coffeaeformis.AAC.1